ncbi:MAG: SEC-C domain-containing protein, partial [Paramuribaculum sp.]|nr:SEC-C domain-containing protein [Paramuribaculum sp.]
VIDEGKIKIVDEQTGRIMEGRRYSDGLHQAIEAKEGVKVEAATQTFATITLQNYFRMYHKLAGMTGTAETEAGEFWDIYKLDVVTIPTNRPVARIDMQDRVYKTKKEKYAAVIDEIVRLVGEGRPVLVGTTSVDISELLSRMLTMRRIPHNVLNAKLHQKEAEIVALAGKAGTVTIATNMAGRGTDIKLPKDVKDAGGLAIIGTERHESRRVDRQLRGRSGRQGDPGSSVFYVSFEDQLMRLFATDRVMKMLDTLGLKEGDMIESKMVTNAIEKAQKRVEENNFGIRKHLLEYDDVMNKQRTYIYSRRHHALMGERVGIDIANMIYDVIENLVNTYSTPGDYADLSLELLKILTIEPPFSEDEFKNMQKEEIIDLIHQKAVEAFDRKNNHIIEVAEPVIKRVVEEDHFQGRVIVPMTDGKRVYSLTMRVEDAYASGCRNIVKEWHKAVLLLTIDELWKEHLRELDQLRQSVRNASYEQKDPLVIYKVESFHLFEQMLNNLNIKAISTLMRGQIYIQQRPEAPRPQPQPQPNPEKQHDSEQTEESTPAPESEAKQAPQPAPEPKPEPKVERAMPERPTDYSQYRTSRSADPAAATRAAASAPQGEQSKPMPAKAEMRIGRNDPCPCGSGKKYKNCHGQGL